MLELRVRQPFMPAILALLFVAGVVSASTGVALFNVKDYGATGVKADDARAAIQKAVDACAAAGGGIVYLPPGEYTSGTIHLKSHVRFHLEAGATLYASVNDRDYDVLGQGGSALLLGEDLANLSIEGRGTVDGQIEYEHRPDNIQDFYIKDNKDLMLALGKSIMRSFPKAYPDRKVFPHLILLVRCKDVLVTGIDLRRSPSWTFRPYQCERLVIDGIHIFSSL